MSTSTPTTTASRDEILAFADGLLHSAAYSDYCVNGMQVEGGSTVRKVASAVSSSAEVFERAAEWGADLLIVHHGLIWRGSEPKEITGRLRERLNLLFRANMTLAAYHLPLDGHDELGNNAIIAKQLGATLDRSAPFGLAGEKQTGWICDLPAPLSADKLAVQVAGIVGQHPTVLGAHNPAIKRVAILSGGGAGYMDEALSLGAEALITGEARENTMADAEESDFTVLAAGHWATEVFGVQALGERIAQQFSVEHTFIEAPNPI